MEGLRKACVLVLAAALTASSWTPAAAAAFVEAGAAAQGHGTGQTGAAGTVSIVRPLGPGGVLPVSPASLEGTALFTAPSGLRMDAAPPMLPASAIAASQAPSPAPARSAPRAVAADSARAPLGEAPAGPAAGPAREEALDPAGRDGGSSALAALEAGRTSGASPEVDFDGRRERKGSNSLPLSALLFPLSTTIHELGHYTAARALGFKATLQIDRILIDGRQKMTPRQSFIVSVAGPAANLVVAGGLALALGMGIGLHGLPLLAAQVMLGTNLSMGVFNLIPMAYPGMPKTDGWQAMKAFGGWLKARAQPRQDVSPAQLRRRDRRGKAGAQDYADLGERLARVAGAREDLEGLGAGVRAALALEPRYAALSARELSRSTERLRARLRKGEALDALLPDAFAAARETMARVLGKRPYVEQLAAAWAIHRGRAVEQKTGEGKTLSIGMAAYLNALAGPVDVLTFNPYLAQRDAGELGEVFAYLGLKVGFLGRQEEAHLFSASPDLPREAADPRLAMVPRGQAYREADVLYGDNAAFVFDHLYDQDAGADDPRPSARRPRAFAIVDEADANLLEEAETDYRIVFADPAKGPAYEHLYELIGRWTEGDEFTVDARRHAIITPAGHSALQALRDLDPGFAGWKHIDVYAANALQARHVLQVNRDYAVVGGQVVILDPHTGYLLYGRHWGEGLHRFVELKEGVRGAADYRLASHIALNNFMSAYGKVSGITGTLGTSDAEFREVYGLPALRIPPHTPSRREDRADRLYRTEDEALAAAVEDAITQSRAGRPVLLGVRDLAESNRASALLAAKGVPHALLNGVQAKPEQEIIDEAGAPGRITVATQLAGRGTDIKLSPEALAAGGLHVALTARSGSLRVDLQYRGRAGRQGQPGSSRAHLSLEDPVLEGFLEPAERRKLEALLSPGGVELGGGAAAVVDAAQARAEASAAEGRTVQRGKDAVLQPIRQRYFALREALRRDGTLGRGFLLSRLHAGWLDFIAEYEELWADAPRPTAAQASAKAESLYAELVERPHRRLMLRPAPWRAFWGLRRALPQFLNGWMWQALVAPLLKPFAGAARAALAETLDGPAQLLALLGLRRAALPLRAAITGLRGGDAGSLREEGALLQKLGRHREAVERFARAMELSTDTPRSTWHDDYFVHAFAAGFSLDRKLAGLKVSALRARARRNRKQGEMTLPYLARSFEALAWQAGREEKTVREAANMRAAYLLEPSARRGAALKAVEPELTPVQRELAKRPFPGMAYAFLFAARQAVDAGDFGRAEELFAAVIELKPEFTLPHFGRGYARSRRGDAQGEADLQRGLYRTLMDTYQFHRLRESFLKARSRSLQAGEVLEAVERGPRPKMGGGLFGNGPRRGPGPLFANSAYETSKWADELFAQGRYEDAFRAYLGSLRQHTRENLAGRPLLVGFDTTYAWTPDAERLDAFFEELGALLGPES